MSIPPDMSEELDSAYERIGNFVANMVDEDIDVEIVIGALGKVFITLVEEAPGDTVETRKILLTGLIKGLGLADHFL